MFRLESPPPYVSQGQHEAIISEELWEQCQDVRAGRNVDVKTQKKLSPLTRFKVR